MRSYISLPDMLQETRLLSIFTPNRGSIRYYCVKVGGTFFVIYALFMHAPGVQPCFDRCEQGSIVLLWNTRFFRLFKFSDVLQYLRDREPFAKPNSYLLPQSDEQWESTVLQIQALFFDALYVMHFVL